MSIITEKMQQLDVGRGQLMDLLGVKATATLDKYINDPLTMSGYQIKEVCDFLGIDPTALFFDIEVN